ncbi:MAG: DMT family transporter [Chromatiales bacterium]|jgi:drug/metabolite transporter (DMT)-like permease|nr:DMT family transporter [Chromatiales bacterium]
MSLPQRHSNAGARDILIGATFMVVGVSTLPAMNALAKYLTTEVPLSQVVWARFLGHLLWMGVLFGPKLGASLFKTRFPREQGVRSVVFFVSNLCFISALPNVELATASAIMFSTPILVVALSGPMLGESISLWRWMAVAVGFAGAIVIIGPYGEFFDPGAAMVLVSAACFAFYQIWTRKLANRERPETMIVYTSLVGAVATTLVCPWFAVAPSGWLPIGAMAGVGLLGGIGQYCIIRALERAPASFISPLGYAELVSATVFGYVVFSEVPGANTWYGAAIIIISGLALVYGETLRRRLANNASR